MDMTDALASLGVTADSIDDSVRERLDRDGYTPLPDVLSAGQLELMRARVDELLAIEGDKAGLEVHQEVGADRLSDLVNLDQKKYVRPETLARTTPAARFILDV